MDALFFIQLFIVLACIGIGGKYGGMGLGAGGGLGVAILVLGFGLKPSSPSITAMLIIICVISAVSILQAVGGLDYLVRVAGNDSNLLIVFYVQIMPDDFVMQLHRF